MELPGGLWENGRCLKAFAFRSVTGALELAITDSSNAKTMPTKVNEILLQALECIGEQAPTLERIQNLSVPDRGFLLRRLQIHLGRGQKWMHARCGKCVEPFDFQLDLSILPVTAAKEGYPLVSVKVGGELFCFRLPTGADQEAIAEISDEEVAQWALLRRCFLPSRGKGIEKSWDRIRNSGAEGFSEIESAMEKVAPEMISMLQARCPQCGNLNEVSIDPYDFLRNSADELLREVHQLAYHYHWSEATILGLAKSRRRQYLRLIDQTRGMAA